MGDSNSTTGRGGRDGVGGGARGGEPSIGEIAALTARLRELSHARGGPDTAADAQVRARFLADKQALLARIPGYTEHPDQADRPARPARPDRRDEVQARITQLQARLGLAGGEGAMLGSGSTVSAEAAAHQLATGDRTVEQARALVHDYLDQASVKAGVSLHEWGLDQADLAELTDSTGPQPAPGTAGAEAGSGVAVPTPAGEQTGQVDPLQRARTAVTGLPVSEPADHSTDGGSAAVSAADQSGPDFHDPDFHERDFHGRDVDGSGEDFGDGDGGCDP